MFQLEYVEVRGAGGRLRAPMSEVMARGDPGTVDQNTDDA